MVDDPEWPAYPVGPKDSIFALGVVSVNYARLEFAVYGMFTSILGLEPEVGRKLMYKTTPEMRDRLMRETLPTRQWASNVVELAQHFICAHKICYENRNKLAHSSLHAMSPDAIILVKAGRDGKGTLANPMLAEFQKVADDMHIYFEFGLWLSNMISSEILGANSKLSLIRPGDRAYSTWPGKPPLPIPLEYTSDLVPIRPLR
jgi:hypothetical protein